MLPARPELTALIVELETLAAREGAFAVDELAARVAEIVLATVSGAGERPGMPSSRDERRVSRVLRHIEEHAEEPLGLAGLAEVALMSKYHFLRTFRRSVGVTPYQFLLGLRLRRAAVRLCTTPASVADIAFDAGFGDLSTFNKRFRDVFGASPGAFRKTRGASA